MLTYLNQRLNQKRGQSTLEYAVLITIIIGALLSIQFYIKRGVQGRLKSAADDIGEQYSQGNTNSIKTVSTHSESSDTFKNGVSRTDLTNEATNSSERSVIVNADQEYMGSN